MAPLETWAPQWLAEAAGQSLEPPTARTGKNGQVGWMVPLFEPGGTRGEHARLMRKVSRWRGDLPSGTVLFLGNRSSSQDVSELWLIEGGDPTEALRFMGTNADNYGRGTAEIIATLERWPNEFGLELDLLYATFDSVGFELLTYPKDRAAFARAAAEFCPDLIEQDFTSLGQLEEYLDGMFLEYLWLWWD